MKQSGKNTYFDSCEILKVLITDVYSRTQSVVWHEAREGYDPVIRHYEPRGVRWPPIGKYPLV